MGKERGIIFNTEMVNAILDGRKTQTRRPVKPSVKGCTVGAYTSSNGNEPVNVQKDGDPWTDINCPFGKIGDSLYVRETWCYGRIFNDGDYECPEADYIEQHENYNLKSDAIYYQWALSNGLLDEIDEDFAPKWKPSIHMPKEYARIWLEITDIRVERVQDITMRSAFNEGFEPSGIITSLDKFFTTWDYLYNNWSDNPWVWVIEFKVV